MESGLLRHIIEIQTPVIEKDEYGANTLVWQTLKKTRAAAKIENGNRVNENNEIVFAYQVRFSVRYYHQDIKETDRIIFNNKKYRILAIFPDNQLQRIIIDTELINE